MRACVCLAGLCLSVPAQAETVPVIETGSVLCSNFDPLTETCRTIAEVTRVAGDLRYVRARRNIALPDEAILLESEGVSRVDGRRSCLLAPTATPRVTPETSRYAEAVLAVFTRKRNFRIERGDCIVYKPCGTGWHLFHEQGGVMDPKIRAFTTIFPPGDPRIPRLSLRERVFGVPEVPPSECEPVG